MRKTEGQKTTRIVNISSEGSKLMRGKLKLTTVTMNGNSIAESKTRREYNVNEMTEEKVKMVTIIEIKFSTKSPRTNGKMKTV